MNTKVDLGPEPLRVLSQTTVVRNGPTYLKLSTLLPSIPRLAGQDLPTAKLEFLPHEVMQNERNDGMSYNHNDISSSSGMQSAKAQSKARATSVSLGRRLSTRPQSREPDASHSYISPRSTPCSKNSNQKPSSSGSMQNPGASISKQKPTSSSLVNPNATLIVHYQKQKVRATEIFVQWYYSIRDPAPASLPKAKDLSRGVAAGFLYLHHMSEDNMDEPMIWIWEVRSDTDEGWTRIEVGHPYRREQTAKDGRFLSISNGGRPSWNKKVASPPTEMNAE